MSLIIVPAVWVVRRGPEMQRYGDPYTDSAVVYRVSSTAYIEAWSGPGPSVAEGRKLLDELRSHGITHVQWERRRADGKIHHVYRRL